MSRVRPRCGSDCRWAQTASTSCTCSGCGGADHGVMWPTSEEAALLRGVPGESPEELASRMAANAAFRDRLKGR